MYFLLSEMGKDVLLICKLQLPDYIIKRQPPVEGGGEKLPRKKDKGAYHTF